MEMQIRLNIESAQIIDSAYSRYIRLHIFYIESEF